MARQQTAQHSPPRAQLSRFADQGAGGSPTVGRAFTTAAASWARSVLDAESAVLEGISGRSIADFHPVLREPGPFHHSALMMTEHRRVARRALGAWLAGVLVGHLHATSSISDAERWFTGETPSLTLGRETSRRVVEALSRALAPGAITMLPYVLDPIPHEYRRHIVSGNGNGSARAIRKERGSFYTPRDVADHIVNVAFDRVAQGSTCLQVLDPAVGTGVFLRSAFARTIDRGVDPAIALSNLFGIDLDECCVDMTAFVLMVDGIRAVNGDQGGGMSELWTNARRQLLAADTLCVMDGIRTGRDGETLATQPRLDSMELPSRSLPLPRSFDIIVGNPPYTSLGLRSDLATLATRYQTMRVASPKTAVWPAFAELLCSKLSERGTGALVVPLSVGSATTGAIRRLRELAVDSGGFWRFEFFDRTPDSLFGDDIKQRTAIAVRTATATRRLSTGPVMRWSSGSRDELFDRLPSVDLGDYNFENGVPKLGSQTQASVYRAMRSRETHLDSAIVSIGRRAPVDISERPEAIYLANTAYNWLSIYRDGLMALPTASYPSTNPLTEIVLESASKADALYALLASRVTFWLWRVEGDAFHVTQSWIRKLPIEPQFFSDDHVMPIGDLSRQLWKSVLSQPVVSHNAGKTTVSYCPYVAGALLDRIDRAVLHSAGQPISFVDELQGFVRQLAIAGRTASQESKTRRALAAWGNHEE